MTADIPTISAPALVPDAVPVSAMPVSATPVEDAAAPSRPALSEVVVDGQEGAMALEYALLTAAIGIPMIGLVFYLMRVVSDMYQMQQLILNLPFP